MIELPPLQFSGKVCKDAIINRHINTEDNVIFAREKEGSRMGKMGEGEREI